jgi:hypothetical protein
MNRTGFAPRIKPLSGLLRTTTLKPGKPTLTAKPKMRKCAICRTPFAQRSMMHKACSPGCAEAVIKRMNEKNAEKAARVERITTRARKEAIKTRKDHEADTQKAVNAVARERDRMDGCITCDKPATWKGQWHASHYLSVGAHPATRFDLSNIHKACSICNNWLSGNLRAYRPRLIAKIGSDAVERLEGPQAPKKYTVDELKALTATHRAMLRTMVANREMESA